MMRKGEEARTRRTAFSFKALVIGVLKANIAAVIVLTPPFASSLRMDGAKSAEVFVDSPLESDNGRDDNQPFDPCGIASYEDVVDAVFDRGRLHLPGLQWLLPAIKKGVSSMKTDSFPWEKIWKAPKLLYERHRKKKEGRLCDRATAGKMIVTKAYYSIGSGKSNGESGSGGRSDLSGDRGSGQTVETRSHVAIPIDNDGNNTDDDSEQSGSTGGNRNRIVDTDILRSSLHELIPKALLYSSMGPTTEKLYCMGINLWYRGARGACDIDDDLSTYISQVPACRGHRNEFCAKVSITFYKDKEDQKPPPSQGFLRRVGNSLGSFVRRVKEKCCRRGRDSTALLALTYPSRTE